MTVQKEGARYARQYFLDIVTVQIQIYLRKGQQAMLDAGIFSRHFGNIQIYLDILDIGDVVTDQIQTYLRKGQAMLDAGSYRWVPLGRPQHNSGQDRRGQHTCCIIQCICILCVLRITPLCINNRVYLCV